MKMSPKSSSKYSVGFAQARLNCLKWVQFNKADVIRMSPDGKAIIEIKKGQILWEYTDERYENGTLNPKNQPYKLPNFDNKPITGAEYEELDTQDLPPKYPDINSAGKTLMDLPECVDTSLRVDIEPYFSIIASDETKVFTSFVFGGYEPSQQVTWEVEGTSIDPPSTITPITPITSAEFNRAVLKVSIRETAPQIVVRAKAVDDNNVIGEALVKLIPEVFVMLKDKSYVGYLPNDIITIDRWIFGGDNKQEVGTLPGTYSLTGNTDGGTYFNPVTGKIIIGPNEKGNAITLCLNESNVPPIPTIAPRNRDCVTIYRRYIEITPHTSPSGTHCGGSQKFTARYRLNDPQNVINVDASTDVTWTISGNTNPNTYITNDGTVIFGNRVTQIIEVEIEVDGVTYTDQVEIVIFECEQGTITVTATYEGMSDSTN